LELNVKNALGYYPLLEAIYNKNIEIVKLLIEYAQQHQIILKYDKKDFYFDFIPPEMKYLLLNYEKNKKIWKKVIKIKK